MRFFKYLLMLTIYLGCIHCQIVYGISYGIDLELKKSMLEQQIEQNPKDLKLYRKLGNILWQMGKYEDALKISNRALHLNHNDSVLFNDRASIYISLERYDDAIKDYQSAIKLDLKDYSSYIGLGVIYRIKKDYTMAVKAYQEVLKLNSTSTIALLGLGKSYFALGKTKEAEECFTKVVKWSDPNGQIRKEALAEIKKIGELQPPVKGPVLNYKGYKPVEGQEETAKQK